MWVFCGYANVGMQSPVGESVMPGLRNKLSAASVRSTTRPGRHADGAGLYLQVTRHPVHGNIRKSWLVRYRADTGRMREIGIGSLHVTPLARCTRPDSTTAPSDVYTPRSEAAQCDCGAH